MDIKRYKELVLDKVDDIADALDDTVRVNFCNEDMPTNLYWARVRCFEIKNITNKLKTKENQNA